MNYERIDRWMDIWTDLDTYIDSIPKVLEANYCAFVTDEWFANYGTFSKAQHLKNSSDATLRYLLFFSLEIISKVVQVRFILCISDVILFLNLPKIFSLLVCLCFLPC